MCQQFKTKTQNTYISPQKIGFDIYLTKYIQDLYEGHYNSDKRNQRRTKQKYIPCSWIEGLNIVKILVFHNLIYKCNTILMKTSTNYFLDIEIVTLKFI